jgi:hypothetical protein
MKILEISCDVQQSLPLPSFEIVPVPASTRPGRGPEYLFVGTEGAKPYPD